MVVLPERYSAQPGLGVRQEHVLEVLVRQHGHLHPLAGDGLRPTQEAGTSWHPQSRFSQSVIVNTLSSLLAEQENGKILGAVVHLCIISSQDGFPSP